MLFSEFLNESRVKTREMRKKEIDAIPQDELLKNNSKEVINIIEKVLSKKIKKFKFAKPSFSVKTSLGIRQNMKIAIKPDSEYYDSAKEAIKEMWLVLNDSELKDEIVKYFSNKSYYKNADVLTCELDSLDSFVYGQMELKLQISLYCLKY